MAATLAVTAVAVACGRATPPQENAAPAPPPGVRAAAVIDSHVHLSFLPATEQLARAGVVAAVDLGAPIETVGKGAAPLAALVQAGPMLTRPNGYPINAWDPGGFGHSCGDPMCVEAMLAAIEAHGGRVLKIVGGEDGLAPELVTVAVAAAHRRNMKVAVHALGDGPARFAATQGCDLLAHTPTEPLSDETVAAWKGRAVVSTLAAFGGRPETVDNVRRLRAAGVTVLYGTDLGNTQTAGVNGDELRLLAEAGLDGPAIVAAMTTAPAEYWGLTGALGDGTYVRLARDPTSDPAAYLEPLQVWIDGRQIR